MDQDAEERAKKQQFLCQEIIEEHYDPAEFEQYCRDVVVHSALSDTTALDIDKWNFLELKLIVKNYKQFAKTLHEQQQSAEKHQAEAAMQEDQDLFENYESKDDDKLRERSETEMIFEQFQKSLVSAQNTDFSSTVWQIPEYSSVSKQVQTGNGGSVNIAGGIPQDPFIYSSFESFEKTIKTIDPPPQNHVLTTHENKVTLEKQQSKDNTPEKNNKLQQQQVEQQKQQIPLPILAQTASKSEMNGNTDRTDKKEEDNSCKNQKIQDKNGIQAKETIEVTNKENSATKVTTMTSTGVTTEAPVRDQQKSLSDAEKEDKRWSSSSNESNGISAVQELELKKRLEELEANNYSQLRQVNAYSGCVKSADAKGVVKLACKKLGLSELALRKDVIVTVPEEKMVQSGLFGSLTAFYVIKTRPMDWEVLRKIDDFEWLHSTLTRMYPGVAVPSLKIPAKKSTLKNNTNTYLEHFLAFLINNPELRNSQFLMDFLSISDQKAFRLKLKDSRKFPKPKNIAYVLNRDGFVRLDYTRLESKTVDESLAGFLDGTEIFYQKLKKLSKELMDRLAGVSNILCEIGCVFTNLHSHTLNFQHQVAKHPDIKVNAVLDAYKVMNNINMMQGTSTREQIRIIENHYLQFFKFQMEHNNTLRQLSKLKQGLQDEYQDRLSSNAMIISLKQTFSSSSSNESVDQPSRNCEVLRDQVAFYTAQLDSQISQFLNQKAAGYATEFSTYANLSKCFQQEMELFWRDAGRWLEEVKRSSHGRGGSSSSSNIKLELMKKPFRD